MFASDVTSFTFEQWWNFLALLTIQRCRWLILGQKVPNPGNIFREWVLFENRTDQPFECQSWFAIFTGRVVGPIEEEQRSEGQYQVSGGSCAEQNPGGCRRFGGDSICCCNVSLWWFEWQSSVCSYSVSSYVSSSLPCSLSSDWKCMWHRKSWTI